MDYLDFGDTIDYNKFNALVYLLRKFKKLTTDLELGAYDINTDYGDFHFTNGFVPVGNNWILEKNVMVITRNCLPNCIYSFVFTVIDVNTSGTVNKRLVRLESLPSGDERSFNLKIPKNLINDDEVILPDFTMEVVFDEHEYYTQLPDIHLSLSVDKQIIKAGETATVTGLLTNSQSEPMANVNVILNVNGTIVTVSTDNSGEFTYNYTGTGNVGRVSVSAYGVSVTFYDGTNDYVTAVFKTDLSSTVKFGRNLISSGNVIIDWGDGTTDTVNNPLNPVQHTYTDGLSEHIVVLDGNVTGLGDSCFMESSLKSINIPDTVTSLGHYCFYGCSRLRKYVLYWTSNPVLFSDDVYLLTPDAVFSIPYGTTSIYTDAGYPLDKLVEREPLEPLDTTLSIASDKQTIYTDETIIITGTLLDEDNNPVKQASIKLYDGNTLIDTLSTDNLGAYSKTISNLSVGSHSLHTSFEATTIYNASTSSNITVTVSEPTYNLVLSSDTPIIQTGDSAIVNALLTHNGSAYSSQSLSYTVKHGSTTIDTGTVTTGSDGTASISYTGTGVGDVSVEVSYGTLLQKTFVVEDCYAFDDALSDKTNTYTTSTISSFTHDTDHYVVNRQMTSASATNYYSHIYPTTIDDLPSKYEFSIDLKIVNKNSDFQSGLQISNQHITTYSGVNELSNLIRQSDLGIFYRVNGNLTRYTGSFSLSLNKWYRLSFKVNGTSVNAIITDLDTGNVLYNDTKTLSEVVNWNKSQLALGGQTQIVHFKNYKVKAL